MNFSFQFSNQKSDLIIRCIIRGLVLDINLFEENRVNAKKDINKILNENKIEISHRFQFVANIVKDDFLIYRECILTIFSINPNEIHFNEIKMIAEQGIVLLIKPHFFFYKFGLNIFCLVFLFHFLENNNTINDELNDVFNCKMLSKETSTNLIILCHHMRIKTLSWNMSIDKLMENCKNFMIKTKN